MMRAWVLWWVLLVGLYLLLAGDIAVAELVVGSVAAAIGATGAILVRRQRALLLRPRLRSVGRPLLGLFGDLVPLARALVTRRGGALVEEPSGALEDASDRALTEALGSLAPATIVVAFDQERGVVLRHRLP